MFVLRLWRIPFIMRAPRAQDGLVKPLTSANAFVRKNLVAVVLATGVLWPNSAVAQIVEAPPHRVEFTVSPRLTKCNDYDAFYGMIVNWVRVKSIDPTAKRKLIVNIDLLPNGKKRERLSVLNAEGVEVGSAEHTYPATEECFKVLYWAAFDSSHLLAATIPPPEEEPPMSVDKLVEESEKPDPVQEKQNKTSNAKPSETGPIYDAEFYSEPKPEPQQCKVQDEPKLPWHLVVGVGTTIGLTRMVMPGFRLGLGRTVGPVMFELDAQVFPPLITAAWDRGAGKEDTGRAQAYLGSFAVCGHKYPLLGCGIVTGGPAGYSYDKPVLDVERYATEKWGGFFGLGLRAGAEISLSTRWALRMEAEGLFPLYMSDFLRPAERFETDRIIPVWSGFVSLVPSF
jgi:hypothetical protein